MNIKPIPFSVDNAVAVLKDTKNMILVGASVPVGFFAYPGKPRLMAPVDCDIHTLATPSHDLFATLEALCQAVGASKEIPAQLSQTALVGGFEDGAPNASNIGRVLVGAMPENTILVDEAITSGRQLGDSIPFAPAHDCIDITGGAIGFGLSAAVGAAIAAPDRRVIALVGDGSAMYTIQALWTMAREQLNVTTVIFDNRSYRILRGELANMGGPAPGENAARMLDLDQPDLDWVSMAKGHGVPAVRVDSLSGFDQALRRANATPGPSLIALRTES